MNEEGGRILKEGRTEEGRKEGRKEGFLRKGSGAQHQTSSDRALVEDPIPDSPREGTQVTLSTTRGGIRAKLTNASENVLCVHIHACRNTHMPHICHAVTSSDMPHTGNTLDLGECCEELTNLYN